MTSNREINVQYCSIIVYRRRQSWFIFILFTANELCAHYQSVVEFSKTCGCIIVAVIVDFVGIFWE